MRYETASDWCFNRLVVIRVNVTFMYTSESRDNEHFHILFPGNYRNAAYTEGAYGNIVTEDRESVNYKGGRCTCKKVPLVFFWRASIASGVRKDEFGAATLFRFSAIDKVAFVVDPLSREQEDRTYVEG